MEKGNGMEREKRERVGWIALLKVATRGMEFFLFLHCFFFIETSGSLSGSCDASHFELDFDSICVSIVCECVSADSHAVP